MPHVYRLLNVVRRLALAPVLVPLLIASLAVIPSPSAHAQAPALPASVAWESGPDVIGPAQVKGLCYDTAGDLYICNPEYKQILIYRRSGGIFPDYPPGFQLLPLTSYSNGYPVAVAVQPGTGLIYVATMQSKIEVYSFNSETLEAKKQTSSGLGMTGTFYQVDQLRFSADGQQLFVTCSVPASTTYSSAFSIVRVLKNTGGNTWSDTGKIIAPRNNTSSTADPNPESNQGQSHGLAVDAGGNVWVASDTDPVVWNGPGKSPLYTSAYGKYARPIRLYQRVPMSGGDFEYVPSAEIPLDNKIMGLAVNEDGTLFAAESINTGLTGNLAGKSHRIYIYQGLKRVGFIDTSTGSQTLEDLQFLDVDPTDGFPTVQGTRSTKRYAQHWTMDPLPARQKHTVSGRVTDAATGDGIEGAVVRMYTVSATTALGGTYTLSVPDSGTADVQNPGVPTPPDPFYIITVDAPGYMRTYIQPFRIHGAKTLDIALRKPEHGVTSTLGEPSVQSGLRRVVTADSDTTIASVAGGTANADVTGGIIPVRESQTGNAVNDYFLRFDIDDSFPHGNNTTGISALATVLWFDNQKVGGTGWHLKYDGVGTTAGDKEKDPGPIVPLDSKKLRCTAFYLPDANFNNRQVAGSDITISEIGDPVTILSMAVQPTGSLLQGALAPGWTGGLSAQGTERFTQAPAVFDGIVYVGTVAGHLRAYYLATGAPVLGFGTNGDVQLAGPLVGRPVVYLTADRVPHICVATEIGKVQSLNAARGTAAHGTIEWTAYPLGDGSSAGAAPTVFLDTSVSPAVPLIFVGLNVTTANGSQAHLVRLRGDTPGTGMLDLNLGDGATQETRISSAPAIGPDGRTVMAGYTSGPDGRLLVVKNPVLESEATTFIGLADIAVAGEPVKVPASLSGDGATMYLGSSNGATGHVHAVNAVNGNLGWSTATGGVESPLWVDYPPAPYARTADTMFVATTDNRLHAFDLNSGQEKTGWPVSPPFGRLGGGLMAIGDNLYMGSDTGLMVTSKTAPGTFKALVPFDMATQASAAILPNLQNGLSASGSTAGQSAILSIGYDGLLYGFAVQP